jgi:hypothetical protein
MSDKKLPPTTLLFAGETLDGRDTDHALVILKDNSTATVRVRAMAARHHLEMVDLFDLGREAELIEKCTARLVAAEGDEPQWVPVDAAFIDNLDDASHVRLVALANALNFSRVISSAERAITSAAGLRELKTKISEQQVAPMLAIMEKQFTSWTSSLTQALSSGLAAKKS